MKVRCISNKPNNFQLANLPYPYKNSDYHITLGNMYVVYGITIMSDEKDKSCFLQIVSDYGALISAPILLFEIIDSRVSQYWKIKIFDNGGITLWPGSFYKEFYHDDLFEGVEDIVNDFKVIRKKIEDEL